MTQSTLPSDAAARPASARGARGQGRRQLVPLMSTRVGDAFLRKPFYVHANLDIVSLCRAMAEQGISDALVRDGRVRRAYLGLVSSPAPLPPAWSERTGQRTALRVVEVVEGSPAARSGLRRGDMVLAVGGTPLGDAQSLQRRLLDDAIGTRIEITVLRNGALVDAVAEPTELLD